MEAEKGFPKITKDGVTVVKNIRVLSQTQEIGVALMREIADTTNRYCGDGTTTSTVIAHYTFKEGLKLVSAGYNPIIMKRGLEKARKEILKFLELISKPIETYDDLLSAALVPLL